MLVSRVVLVVAVVPYLVWAQLGGPPDNSATENCECSPACESGGGCRGRLVAREDCPCCRVCAHQEGDSCSLPSMPCDVEFGLVCSSEGVCKAEFSCTYDGECPSDRFCLGGVCVDPCPILTPCHGSLHGGVCVSKDHRPVCECPPGTLANSEANVCIPYNGTVTGCEHEGRLYSDGEVRYTGKCQEQCRCGPDGTFSCGPVLCPAGLFLAGQHSQQELCIELRNRPETDECCVVVACANSLARPSLLTAPVFTRPGVSEDEHLDDQQVQQLRGRMVGPEPLPPITEEDYQRRLKQLEEELSKKNEKKKITDVKSIEKSKHLINNDTAVSDDTRNVTVVEVVTELSIVRQEENVTSRPEEVEESVPEIVDEVTEAEGLSTMMPMTEDDEQLKDVEEPAVVVEYDDSGDLLHRITIKEHVEVVTQSHLVEDETATLLPHMIQHIEEVSQPQPVEDETTTLLPLTLQNAEVSQPYLVEDETTTLLPHTIQHVEVSQPHLVEEETATDPTPLPREEGEDLSLAREGKKVPEDTNVTQMEQPSTESPKAESKGGSGSLKVVEVTRSSATVLLPSSKGGEVYYKAAESSEWQREVVEGGQDSLVLRDLLPSTQYALKWSGVSGGSAKTTFDTPGITPDFQTTTTAPTNAGLPKLLVTAKTHNSVTLAWDDFRARTYEGGYVAEYRKEHGDSSTATGTTVEQPWMRKEVPAGELPPKLTVKGLEPNTLYEVRVSIYDDVEEGRLGEATETINVRTEAGCVHGNSSYPVGEFYNGCEERCMCAASGSVRCFARCTLPYLRAGSLRGDPQCHEEPDERDECCVLVRCSSDRREAYNQCTNVVCGPNAECISGIMASKDLSLSDVDSDLTLGYCRCLVGFTGDASDLVTGCLPDPSAGHKERSCTFKNSTYGPGDVFYDECEFRCSCNNNSEIECQPRCEFPRENVSKPESGCKYLPDPEDPCCKLRTCNSTSDAAIDATRNPSLSSDGCTDGNVTYAKNEKFYKGCETQCICMGFGDVSCFPRCPPLKVVSATPKRCETLPDPLDSCCSITVCDEETPDVMKANITELEKEIMKNMTEIEKDMMMKEMMNMTDAEKMMMMKGIMNITEEKEVMMKNITDMQEMSSVMDTLTVEDDTPTTSVPEDEMLLQIHFPHNMNETNTNEHTHEDGTTHSHPHEHHKEGTSNHTHSHQNEEVLNKTKGQDIIEDQIFQHDIFNGTHNHTHSHENGVTHIHPHEHNMDNFHDHSHDMNNWHNNEHEHEDGVTHSHPLSHGIDNPHDNSTNITQLHEHTHEDGTTHSHALNHIMNHSHDNSTNNTHMNDHTHEDSMINSDSLDDMNETDIRELTMNKSHNHTHMHEEGVIHIHPHDQEVGEEHNHTLDSGMDEVQNNTQTTEDNVTHSPHMNDDGMLDLHNNTHFGVLKKKNRAEDLGTHDLNILEVMAINATTVMIKVAVSDSVMNQVHSSESQHFMILYSPDSLTWSERNISVSDAKLEKSNEIILYLNDLQPSTPYQFRVAFQDFVSSTSKARLMDGAAELGKAELAPSHVGCLPGMQFMEEIECGRHCTCQADGQAICKPRCPDVEIPPHFNTSCMLVPSPDDPCCTVPDCHFNSFNHNILHKFGDVTDNPPVEFGHSALSNTKQKNTNEHENVLIMNKPFDRNQEFDNVSSLNPPDVVDVRSSTESHPKHTTVTENSHLVRNTLIPEDQAASDRSWKPFISLNDLLNKHNQLGNIPQDTSTGVPPRQVENSEVSIGMTKETSPNLPSNLNQLITPQRNSSVMTVEDQKDIEINDSSREIPASLHSSFGKEFGSLSDTKDHETSHVLDGNIEDTSGISFLLPIKNDTHLPNYVEEDGTPLSLLTSIKENEVGSSPDKDKISHSAAIGEHQLVLSLSNHSVDSGNDSIAEILASEISPSSIIILNASDHFSNEHHRNTDNLSTDYETTSYLPIEDREGSLLPNEHRGSLSVSHEHHAHLSHENKENSHVPKDNKENRFLHNEHILDSDLTNEHIDNSHVSKENRGNTNQSKERLIFNLSSITEDLSPLPTSEEPPITPEDVFAPVINETNIEGHIKDGTDGVGIDKSAMCSRNGRYYKAGEDFYEGCSHSCLCTEKLEVHCAAIECPVTFGLELIDPNCLEWDHDPDYVPTPPKCCAQVKCISSSACQYMGQTFNNYDQIPRELTGCSQVCTCNYGNVTCHDLCDPVPIAPPPELNCEPQNAVLITLPGETCCRSWQCTAHSDIAEVNDTTETTHFDDITNTPEVSDFSVTWSTASDDTTISTTEITTTGTEDFTLHDHTYKPGAPAIFPLPPVSVLSGKPTSSGFVPIVPPAAPSFGTGGISEPHTTSLDPRTVHFFFSTPSLYQGLPGELLIRFTSDPTDNSDPSTWSQEVLVPMGSIISQSEWDHILTGLQPSTEYAMQIVLTVQGTKPIASPVFTYTTSDEATTPPTTTPLPRLDINAELYASAITKTTAKVSWRGFNDYELQFIDGVQVKYTEKDKYIPKFSQLFHRDNNQMDLRDLQPGHSYTVDLVFITHENQTTQVSNTKPITFTTLPEEDPYAFEIEVTAGKVGSQTAELFYSGVPEPEEKYVSVYRAVYLREDERVDADTFKVPKSGLERKIFLSELKPDVEYQVWLEAFLSNGRKKKSNVLTITTRAGELPKPERSEVDPSAKDSEDGEGYYPALVAVAIIAALACLGFLALLVILLRKQSHAKAHINSSRNNGAYDNPSYKVGDNTYDMEMNGIKGSGNGATHSEEP
nr:uncharacterized protein LOC128684573 isoform X4 [Cherax quadricarinatus]